MMTVKLTKYAVCAALVIGVVASHSSFAALKVIDRGPLHPNNWGIWISPAQLTVVPLQNVICTVHSEEEPKQITNGQSQFELNPLTDSLTCNIAPIPQRSDDTSTVPDGAGQ